MDNMPDASQEIDHGVHLYDISTPNPVLGSVPYDQVEDAIKTGQYSFPKGQSVRVLSPEGERGEVPADQAHIAFQQGYKYLTPSLEQHAIKHETYGTTAQQWITGLEGAASAATFGLSTGIERALGVTPEEMQARQEENPISYGAGQMGGLLASALVPFGEGAILAKAGEAAAGLAGIGEATGLARIGSAAVRGAAENMLFQGGDEVSKMFMNDPDQSVQSAIVNTGLSGLLGGVIGGGVKGAGEAWKAGPGKKLGEYLSMLKDKVDSSSGVLSDDVHNALLKAGIEPSDAIKSLHAENPHLQDIARNLSEASTASGTAFRDQLTNYKNEIAKASMDLFGKAPEQLAEMQSLNNISQSELGMKLKDSVASSLESKYSPIANQYEAFTDTFKKAPLSENIKRGIADEINNLSLQEGWSKSQDGYLQKLATGVIEDLGKQETVNDLTNYIKNMKQFDWFSTEGNVQKKIKGVLNGAIENTIAEATQGKSAQALRQGFGESVDNLFNVLSENNPETKNELIKFLNDKEAGHNLINDMFQKTKANYGQFRGTLEDLNDRLHVGKFGGFKSFIENLKGLKDEAVVNRLANRKDAGLIDLLQKNFPEVAESVKGYHQDTILQKAVMAAKEGDALSLKTLYTDLSKMSPEMREYVLGDKLGKFEALKTLTDSIPDRLNSSGSGRVVDAALKKSGMSPLGLLAMAANPHHSTFGNIMALLSPAIMSEGADAVKLGFLKFMGSSKDVSSEGLKALISYADSIYKGQTLMQKGVNKLFDTSSKVLPDHMFKSVRDTEKLGKIIDNVKSRPDYVMLMGEKPGYYAPEHSASFSKVATQTVSYLDSIKPNNEPQNMLDLKLPVPDDVKHNYIEALKIADQPLTVLQHIKDNTLTLDHVKHIATMYPDLYGSIKNQMMEKIYDIKQKGKTIPYTTRMSMSLFMGHPLDSSMMPNNIMQAHLALAQTELQKEAKNMQPGMGSPRHGQLNKLTKFSSGFATPGQMREMQRSKI